MYQTNSMAPQSAAWVSAATDRIHVVTRLAKQIEEATAVANDLRNRLSTFNDRATGPRPTLSVSGNSGNAMMAELPAPKTPGQLGGLQDHLGGLLATLYSLREEMDRADEIL